MPFFSYPSDWQKNIFFLTFLNSKHIAFCASNHSHMLLLEREMLHFLECKLAIATENSNTHNLWPSDPISRDRSYGGEY